MESRKSRSTRLLRIRLTQTISLPAASCPSRKDLDACHESRLLECSYCGAGSCGFAARFDRLPIRVSRHAIDARSEQESGRWREARSRQLQPAIRFGSPRGSRQAAHERARDTRMEVGYSHGHRRVYLLERSNKSRFRWPTPRIPCVTV